MKIDKSLQEYNMPQMSVEQEETFKKSISKIRETANKVRTDKSDATN